MSLRDSQFGELKVPLTWTAAVALVVAAVVAVALLMTDRRGSLRAEAYGVTRGVTDTVAAPVGDALSAPGRWIGDGVDAVRGYFFAVSENRELKTELKQMQQWREVATALKNENNRYRSLLGLKTDPPIPMVAARVVTDSRGPFADTRLANAGSEAGVKPGNPVMSENGLVGRVLGVTNGASRVLLLTDAASRTPVMIDRSNARAILAGDGGPNPRLDYLRGQNPVKEGDLVLTSGDGGLMPRGLPVGVAVKGLDGKWRVVLASDRGPIDFVRILLFQDFSQIIDRKALDKGPVPPPTPGAETLEPAAPPAIALAAPKPAAPVAAGAAGAIPGAKPADAKTADGKTVDAKTVDAKPGAAKADDAKADLKPTSVKPGSPKPADGKAAAAKPAAGAAKPASAGKTAAKTAADGAGVKATKPASASAKSPALGGKTTAGQPATAKSATAKPKPKPAAKSAEAAAPKPARPAPAAGSEEPPL
jgi:rod shape-determining protein MreC